MNALPFDSVLLIAFGGPTRPEEIRPFLENITRGRQIPPERLEDVAHHYELIGGRSPLNELTFRQADGLREALRADGRELPVYVGMRNWNPYLHETLEVMAKEGRRRAVGVILSAQQSEASWDRYKGDVAAARLRVGESAPEVDYADEWHAHPGFIGAVAAQVEDALARVPAERRGEAQVVFTAHSIPTLSADESPYVAQIEEGARLVADKVGHRRWSVAYQSRSGNPRDPWLEPDICDVLRNLADKGTRDVVVEPIGFICDHAEVLYDLDIEANQVAGELGINFVRAPSVNDHPAFIRMLADVVRAHVRKHTRA
jgi:ferrochelatase